MSQIHVFGIRHHGPGCARSVLSALEELQPDAILLEAPADAETVLPLVRHAEMIPPVALLIFPHDQPRRSVSYPLAEFSPEWQVLRWAADHQRPVRLMDLPMAHRLALDAQAETPGEESTAGSNHDSESSIEPVSSAIRTDPIALLAEAAGYSDHELWWEEQIERRLNATGLFAAILEAMQTVREEFPENRQDDLLREAFMRKTIRKARKEFLGNLAIVCGAWHGPVLTESAILGKLPGCQIKEDNARLKGIPKLKTTATWIPWTHSRLSYQSGYGAGIESPGWYSHLWDSPSQAPIRWLTSAARLLRERDLDASSASIIEAARLAETTAAIRELRSPGLRELNEAIVSLFCNGDESPLKLIRHRLEIGDRLGNVPAETPSVPLAENLAKLQKSLRMKPSPQRKLLDLDLRKETSRERSFLLHRLAILEIHWGTWQSSGGGDSTFHELWELEWQPEFAVSIIEANVWGNTVEAAASNRTIDQGAHARELSQLSELLKRSILADLKSAILPLLDQIQTLAAVSVDVQHLMDAVFPLAQIVRYSDVRKTAADAVLPIVCQLFERILVGLPSACSGLDDSASEEFVLSMVHAQEALDLLGLQELLVAWTTQLQRIIEGNANGLVRGWACRTLLEKGILDSVELERITRWELSPVTTTQQAAVWLTGLLRGSGLVLIHQDLLWAIMDGWLSSLPEPVFVEMLPVLRRAFGGFSSSERRQMGEKVKSLQESSATHVGAEQSLEPDRFDHERAAQVLPRLAEIMGTSS